MRPSCSRRVGDDRLPNNNRNNCGNYKKVETLVGRGARKRNGRNFSLQMILQVFRTTNNRRNIVYFIYFNKLPRQHMRHVDYLLAARYYTKRKRGGKGVYTD